MDNNGFIPRVRIVCLILTILLSTVFVLPAYASDATNYTYTISADGVWIRTQDAYLVSTVLMKKEELFQPEDIFFHNDTLYIADTGNSRIVIYDIHTKKSESIGQDVLNSPTGVFVTDDELIYVADTSLQAVVMFNRSGNIIRKYQRPIAKTFGSQTQFAPAKVAVDSYGTLYIVSEGSYDGMIQMDKEGNFLGYFGYNNNPRTLSEYLMELFFTDEQKSQLFNRVPFTFKNLAMDKKGIVYSITQSVSGDAIKKHDYSGKNLLPDDMYDEENFVDIAIGLYGQIYALTQTGLLYEYDSDGNLLFSLGGLAIAQERNGLITAGSGLTTDEYGNVYILDRERGTVQVLTPTEITVAIHKALNDYNNGYYNESFEIWEEISRLTGESRIALNGMANCLFQLQDYDAAAMHYKKAENRDGYSDAYWQIRSRRIGESMPVIAALIIGCIVAYIAFKYSVCRRQNLYNNNSKLKHDVLLALKVLRHPIDSFNAIRRQGAGSIGVATLLYVLGYVVFVANFVFRGFVVSTHTPENTSLLYVSVLYIVPVGLFVFSNFFIGEINESEGRFRDIYIATAYVMSPFIVMMPFLLAISHFITNEESRLFFLVTTVVYVWVFVLLLISTREVHAYSFPEVIKNLLITLFMMAVIVLAVSLVGMFWDRLIEFVWSVAKEVKHRVS